MSEDTAVKQKGDFKSKRNIILIILIAIIIVFVGILNYFTSKNLYNGKIAQNIYIEDVNVSNMKHLKLLMQNILLRKLIYLIIMNITL